MIKHRFIVRGADDFKIFAAIPCESQVLTWKKWVRPPDVDGLRALITELIESFSEIMNGHLRIRDAYAALATLPHSPMAALTERVLKDSSLDSHDKERFKASAAEQDAYNRNQATNNAERCASTARSAKSVIDEACVLMMTLTEETFQSVLATVVAQLKSSSAETTTRALQQWDDLARDSIKQLNAGKNLAPREVAEAIRLFSETADASGFIADKHADVRRHFGRISDMHAALSDPLPDTPCLPGTPFSAYTIEFNGSIFSVVEGCAWVAARNLAKRFSKHSEDEARQPGPDGVYPPTPSELWFKVDTATLDELSAEHTRGHHGISVADQDRLVEEMQTALLATDEEKRVVEIVTQMLVERGLNPKAPERIPVVEVDPKDANHTREAEHRDQQASRAPKVRTIKFHVSPPRYLREAVRRIAASPGKHKKAHWVGGFWRNQPYGEKQSLRKRKWIKPHIRGLGEAGAVVARVAVADEEVAALHGAHPSCNFHPPKNNS